MSGIRTVLCPLRAALAGALAVASLGAATPAVAATALPDGRVLERVSAAKRNGNLAGVHPRSNGTLFPLYAAATSSAIVYWGGGPQGETSSGTDNYSVSRRNPNKGWETGAALPPEAVPNADYPGAGPLVLLPSADFSRFVFSATGPYLKENFRNPLEDTNLGLYRTRGNSSEPEWLTKPTATAVSKGMGEVTEKSTVVKNVHGLTGGIKSPLELPLGARVVGQKIPAGTTITRVTSTEIELANAVEGGGATAFNEELEVSIAKPAATAIETGVEDGLNPVGGSSDLSTVYFTYFGTLVPADELRYPLVQPLTYKPWQSTKEYEAGEIVEEENGEAFVSIENANKGNPPIKTLETSWQATQLLTGLSGPHGFYEWHEGELRSAGELPGGTPPSRFGAVPAVTGRSGPYSGSSTPFSRYLQNEVSQDGSRAFFVSPEPSHAPEATAPTELYVREQTPSGPKTVLVSHNEASAPAPALECASTPNDSTCAKTAVTPVTTRWSPQSYVYASPDGSRAFFQSKDALTSSAPGGAEPKTYEFNVSTEKVTYLPEVVGPIAASSQDGSSFIFMNAGTKKIELWSGGPAPVEIAGFSTPSSPQFEGSAANDGAAFVFNTDAVLTRSAQTFNNSAHLLQAYRYEPSSNKLECLSCAQEGTQHAIEEGSSFASPHPRELADEGARVFFGTATKLLASAVNGVENVYEWEQAGTGSCQSAEQEGGCLYLVSPGSTPAPSFYLESDESGENVFFATTAALVTSDTDESYDVYDARVNGGFPEEAPPAECGSSCRFAGAAPSLATPLTTALGPAENTNRLESSGVLSAKTKPKPLTRAQKLANALKACAKKPKPQRAACIKLARKLYGAKAKTKRNTGSARRRR